MATSALILLAEGFEEIEAVSPIDLLRRAEISVTIASCGQGLVVQGRSNLSIQSDCMLKEVQDQQFDLLILPGGPVHPSQSLGCVHTMKEVRNRACTDCA